MRLVTFGCSITYGQALTDNHPGNKFPSSYAWPQVLGNMTALETVNLGRMGASCKEIVNKVLEYNYQPDDVVIICWSYKERWCIIDENENITRIGPWMWENFRKPIANLITNTANNYYDHLWNDYDSWLAQQRHMKLAKLYLDSIGIKNYHASTSIESLEQKKWLGVDLLDIDIKYFIKNFKRAHDGIHPGRESHYHIAQDFYNKTNGLQL